jgi:uncharacterized protein YuzE
MKILLDEADDALYLRLDESAIVESEEVQPGVILDYNDRDEVIGIELLGLRARVPALDLTTFQVERT